MARGRVYGLMVMPIGLAWTLMRSISAADGAEIVADSGSRRGSAEARAVADDADLVLIVSGEHGGAVGPCGCDGRPLGGLARQEAYVQAVEATGAQLLVAHVGGWLDATAVETSLTDEAAAANARWLKALRRVRVDVMNVGWSELGALQGRARPGLVSANLHGGNGVLDYVVRDVGGLDVLVTGVSREGRTFLWPEEASAEAAVGSVARLIEGVASDLVVVLVYDDPRAAIALAALPGVDVVVEASAYQARWPASADGAVRVRTWNDGSRLTELRLWVGEGVERVMHREIDLDDTLGEAWRGPAPMLAEGSSER